MMDCLKSEETVTVYPTVALPALDQKPVAKFKGRAYSRAGFDHYTYKGTMYDGYVDANLNPCIFLDRPTGGRCDT